MYLNNQRHKERFWREHDEDSFECENCGAANKPIHVHHKDGNVGNGSMQNLVGLCKSCHKIEHEKMGGNDEPEVEGWMRGFRNELLSE